MLRGKRRPQYRRPFCHQRLIGNQSGIVLIENLVAMLIFTIGIIGIMALQSAMISNTTEARYRAEATYLANKRLSELWTTTESDRINLVEDGTAIADAVGLPSAERDTIRGSATNGCAGAPNCYTVVVKWTPPGGTQRNVTLISFIDS